MRVFDGSGKVVLRPLYIIYLSDTCYEGGRIKAMLRRSGIEYLEHKIVPANKSRILSFFPNAHGKGPFVLDEDRNLVAESSQEMALHLLANDAT